jgi:hypothetical protein
MNNIDPASRHWLAGKWLLANLFAAILYLGVASISWIEPELAEFPGASGGAGLVWFMTAVPVFLLSVALNLGALARAYAIRRREGLWPASGWAWLLVLLWILALYLDNSRHGA